MSIEESRASAARSPMDPRWISLIRVAALALATGAAAGTLTDRVVLAADPADVPLHLDEELAIRFRSSVSRRRVGPDTIRIRTGDDRQARGTTMLGRFLYDKTTQRRAVVRPEAVQEYYQLSLFVTREAAQKKAARLLASIERTGKLRKLDAVDRGLRTVLGVGYGAGTRLDDAEVSAAYPPTLASTDELARYRHQIAGDDELWAAHTASDLSAFDQLRSNPQYERFYHPVDPESGVPDAESVLRQREHRRVLIRRNRRTVLFLPDLPTRADLTDAGFEPAETYSLSVRRPLRGAKRLVTGLGVGARLTGGRASLLTASEEPLLVGVDERIGVAQVAARPRVVNVTPPNGERLVDATTDWEDPDNMFEVPLPARRTFTVRLRFAQPLDPRTVDEIHFSLFKVAQAVGTPEEADVNEQVDVGVLLSQTRLGEVRVDVTPVLRLDPGCRYRVLVRGEVKSLSGERLAHDYQTLFETL